MISSTDTMSTSLTFIAWEVAKHLEWQQKVHEELKQTRMCGNQGILKYSDLELLGYLGTVITEEFRIQVPTPSSLPQVVPKYGAKIGGIWVPENVKPHPLFPN